MKLISEHLGEIIVALCGVAILIGAVTFFKPQLADFFSGIIEKLTALGDDVLDEFDSIDLVPEAPAGP